MSEEVFLLPDVGEGLVEAEIVTWKVAVGDVVTLNQPLVDIETAKATVELPSPYAGTVVALHGNVGDVMEVHKPLITFEVGGNARPPRKSRRRRPAKPKPRASSIEQSPEAIGAGREAVLVGYGVANEDGVATRKHRRAGRTGATTTPSRTTTAPHSRLGERGDYPHWHRDAPRPFVSTRSSTALTSRRSPERVAMD